MVDEKWKTWTWAELRRYAIVIKGLSKETWEKRRRYLKHLEEKYDFNLHSNPDEIYEKFMKYIEQKRMESGQSENAIRFAKNAIQLLFEFLNVKHNYIWPRSRRQQPEITIPPDSVIHRLIHGYHVRDPVLNKEFQYMFHMASIIGPRVPLEIAIMKVRDIDFEEGTIKIWQPKVRKWRIVYPPKFLLDSPVDKSLKNWIDIWRPKLETSKSADYLWLNQDGLPWNVRALGMRITRIGKKYWHPFHGYLLRHYAATRYLIESYNKFGVFDVMGLKIFMGHENIKNTLRYVHLAEKIIAHQQRQMAVSRIRVKKNLRMEAKMLPESHLILKKDTGGPMGFFPVNFINSRYENLFVDFFGGGFLGY